MIDGSPIRLNPSVDPGWPVRTNLLLLVRLMSDLVTVLAAVVVTVMVPKGDVPQPPVEWGFYGQGVDHCCFGGQSHKHERQTRERQNTCSPFHDSQWY